METIDVRVDFFEWGDIGYVDPEVHACLIVEEHGDGTGRCGMGYRPGLPDDQLLLLGEWALQRVGRFLEHGPEPDGWQQRSDGGWQVWARLVDLPTLD